MPSNPELSKKSSEGKWAQYWFAHQQTNLWESSLVQTEPNKMLTYNKFPDISPAKMVLSRIIRELEFGVCKQWTLFRFSLHLPRWQGRNIFIEGGKKVERAIVNIVRGFSSSESLPEKKNIPSSYWVLLSSHDMGAPPSGLSNLFAWDFCLLLLLLFFFFTKYLHF